MTRMPELHPTTGQPLAPYRGHGAPLERRPRHRSTFEPPATLTPAKTIRETVAAWLASIDAVEQLKRQALVKPNGKAQNEAREQLYDAGQDLIARVRQSFGDAL